MAFKSRWPDSCLVDGQVESRIWQPRHGHAWHRISAVCRCPLLWESLLDHKHVDKKKWITAGATRRSWGLKRTAKRRSRKESTHPLLWESLPDHKQLWIAGMSIKSDPIKAKVTLEWSCTTPDHALPCAALHPGQDSLALAEYHDLTIHF
eukprot:1147274-Pelagomonas_calceolata.AAC.1